jgi:endonuclease/exonuclease/phosphatase (EEP) superfamily protein YafD
VKRKCAAARRSRNHNLELRNSGLVACVPEFQIQEARLHVRGRIKVSGLTGETDAGNVVRRKAAMSAPSKEKPGFFSLRVRLSGLFMAAGLLAACATIAGFLGSLAWYLDLCAHFRVQCFLALSIVSIALLLDRRRRLAAVFGALALANLAVIVPLYLGRPAAPATGAKPIRALLANVNAGSGDPARTVAFIRQTNPDIVVLEEISSRWLPALAPVLSNYPHAKIEVREDSFGMLLCSRYPFTQAHVVQISAADVPSVVAEVDAPQGRFTVIATHPLPPASREYAAWRDSQLAAVPAVVRHATSPVVLLGDLNTTPWGAHFRRLVRDSGLQDSARGRGVHATWPTVDPLLWIPIDHCLLSPSIGVVNRQVGPDIGSDHYPLIVNFTLPLPHP